MAKSSIADRYLRTLENNHIENAPKSPPKSLKSPEEKRIAQSPSKSPSKSELGGSPTRFVAHSSIPTALRPVAKESFSHLSPLRTESKRPMPPSPTAKFSGLDIRERVSVKDASSPEKIAFSPVRTSPVKSASPISKAFPSSDTSASTLGVNSAVAKRDAVPKTVVNSTSVAANLGPPPDRNPLMHNQDLTPSQVSWDKERKNWQTYEYLCHVMEAKEWMEKILHEELPAVDQFPESLQNGIALAKLVQTLRPDLMKWPIFQHKRLQYRHTENITQFFDLLEELRIPQLFLFDMTDLYEKRNLPKVIYCIHAVSHFIAESESKVEAIDNLVGKLQFSEDQINTTEKGLIGHSMPNFGAMSRQLSGKQAKMTSPEEPEAVVEEEEEERIEKVSDYEIEKEYSQISRDDTRLPSRGNYTHAYDISEEDDSFTYLSPPRRIRDNRKSELYRYGGTSDEEDYQELRIKPPRRYRNRDRREYSDRIDSFTASTRAVSRDMYHRRHAQSDRRHMRGSGYRDLSSTGSLRSRVLTSAERMLMELEDLEPEIIAFVAMCRGALTRRALKDRKKNKEAEQWVSNLQAYIRGQQLRISLKKQNTMTKDELESLVAFQSIARAKIIRKSFNATATGAGNLIHFQSLARGLLTRRRLMRFKTELHSKESVKSIVHLQSAFRGIITRFKLGCSYDDLDQHIGNIVTFQACARGTLTRRHFEERRAIWMDNVDKVVLIQSFWRAKAQGSRYRILVTGKKPDLEAIRPFLQLIDDKLEDVQLELELENIMKEISKCVKNNERLEAVIEQLDMKITLLSKNNISIDELVLQQQRQNEKLRQELKREARSDVDDIFEHHLKHHETASVGNKADLKEPFDPKTLQKPSRDRIELYQGLFYILQTQPSYISKLMTLQPPRSLDIADLVLAVFGKGDTPREMFFLLRQLAQSITQSTVGSTENTVAWCIVSHLNRREESTDVARKVLAPAAEKLKAMSDQLLEYDPHLIYEHLTGGGNLTAEAAIQDQAVQAIFVQNLHRLREIVMTIVQSIAQHISEFPYHIRFIAREVYREVLRASGDHKEAMAAVGQVVISQFLQPALINADSLYLVDAAIGNTTKNLTLVGRVLHQVGLMSPFTAAGGTDVYLQPLNDFVRSRAHQLSQSFLSTIVEAPDLQVHFGITEMDDITMHERPLLNITMDNIFSVHYMCYNHENVLVNTDDTILKPVIDQLGPLPRDAREMLDLARFKDVRLELNPKYGAATLSDSTNGVSSLLATAKRCLGYVLRVQSNEPNVMSVLVAPVTLEDEHKYNILLDTENTREAAGDLAELTFRDLKALTLEIVLELESSGHVSREDDYQVLVKAIAEDIRNKDAVRQKRLATVESKRRTLRSIQEKGEYLQNRAEIYSKHINEAMTALQTEAAQHLNAAKAKRFQKFQLTVPKTHSNLDNQNPRFGSYRVSAEKLYEKGILIRLRGYSDRERKDIYFNFSSNEVSQLQMDVTSKNVLLPNGSIKFSLDELLGKQYGNETHIDFMSNTIQFSTNRLLHLILSKFFATRS